MVVGAVLIVRQRRNKDDVDLAVLSVLRRAGRDLATGEVAERCGMTVMGASNALRRLVDAGHAWCNTEIVDTPSRYRSTVVLYRVAGRVWRDADKAWPTWMCPADLPERVLAILRVDRG